MRGVDKFSCEREEQETNQSLIQNWVTLKRIMPVLVRFLHRKKTNRRHTYRDR